MQNNLAEKINAILPQTQCGKCEFSGCAPYAKAISVEVKQILINVLLVVKMVF